MMKFSQFYLSESIQLPEIWYHGTKSDFDKFSSEFIITKESIAQEGPGIYLTTDRDDAERYGFGEHGTTGYLKEVNLSRKNGIRKENTKFRDEFAASLIRRMPDKEETLSNWDENPVKAMNMLKQSILENSDNLKEMILCLGRLLYGT